MQIVCLDLEGVLVPEIWIEFANRTGIEALRRTTRDEPDYDKLMKYRLDILRNNQLGLPDIQKVIAEMEHRVPLRRLGQPEEIANVYAFLASDEASYINGAVIEVSGGMSV